MLHYLKALLSRKRGKADGPLAAADDPELPGILLDQAKPPAGWALYAIGDIHGRDDLLARLLDQLAADMAKREGRSQLIFLGDYIDRGLDSRAVIDRLLGRLPGDVPPVFLCGNHDHALLQFLDDPGRMRGWFNQGAQQTLLSYGVMVPDGASDDTLAESARALAAALPMDHRRFFDQLGYSHSAGDFFFCHAGVRPGVPLDLQSPHDLMWIRGEFLGRKRPFSKIIVHGHTPSPEPVLGPIRIGIDTGAYMTGTLTAVRLDDQGAEILSVAAPA